MRVVFLPKVEDYLVELSEILYQKEYFGFKDSAVRQLPGIFIKIRYDEMLFPNGKSYDRKSSESKSNRNLYPKRRFGKGNLGATFYLSRFSVCRGYQI